VGKSEVGHGKLFWFKKGAILVRTISRCVRREGWGQKRLRPVDRKSVVRGRLADGSAATKKIQSPFCEISRASFLMTWQAEQ